MAGDQAVQELLPPVRAARLFAREAQNGHADWYLLSQVAAQCFSHCTRPCLHIRHQVLETSLALFQSAVECAQVVKVCTTTLLFLRHSELVSSSCKVSTSVLLQTCDRLQEDPACLFAWCDEYTLVCTLRACLLAQMAFAPLAQDSFKSGSTDDNIAMEQHDGLDSSHLPRLVAEISELLQTVVSTREQILQPVCQRSIEEVLLLLAQVKECPNAWH